MSGDVVITIVDGGASVVVPGTSVQVLIATATSGTVASIVATQSPKTLQSTFTSGPLVECGAMACRAGGTVLAMRAATDTAGASSSVTMTRVAASTCVVSVTGTPVDEYYVAMKVVTDGTIGTAGCTVKVSLDAGRSYGPTLALGTANTLAITGTGLTLNFAVGDLDAGDMAFFGTTPPLTAVGAVQDCLDVLMASQYAIAGWGSTHVANPFSGSDASTIQTYLNAFEAQFIYTRAIISASDASPAAKWGGSGTTEASWISALATSYSAVSAKRICAAAGNYNMPTAFPTANAGTPRYRRPLSWALAARQVAIPPQRHAGRVKDGQLSQIVVDPTNDPNDGFIYHDERVNVGLTEARFAAARTRVKKPGGFYIAQPNLMSPVGSVFSIMPYGNVMDLACSIVVQVGQDEINDDIRLNSNGTIFETDAQRLEGLFMGALKAYLINKSAISSAEVVVDRSNNIATTSEVNVDITILARGYILSEQISIGFKNPLAA